MPTGHAPLRTNEDEFVENSPNYDVNALGQVRSAFGDKQTIGHVVIDGIPYVPTKRYWKFPRSLDGYTAVADLVALTFKPTQLPLREMIKCSALPIDGNEFNLHPSNLVWMFPKEGIEVKWLPGYRYIPGFTRYGINVNSHIINLTTLFKKPGALEATNRSVRITSDTCQSYGMAAYRFLALAFVPYPCTVAKLSVNHIDGNGNNGCLSNLEWTTTKENSWHGHLRKALGHTPPSFLYKEAEFDKERIEEYFKEKNIDLPTFYGIAYDCGVKLSVYDPMYKRPLNSPKVIIRLDIHTMEKMVYEKQAQACWALGIVNHWQVTQSLKASTDGRAGVGLVKGKYLFRYEGDEFPEITPEFITTALRRGGTLRPVLVKDPSGQITEYPSAARCIEARGLSKKIVTYRLAKGVDKMPDTGLLIAYKDSTPTWGNL